MMLRSWQRFCHSAGSRKLQRPHPRQGVQAAILRLLSKRLQWRTVSGIGTFRHQYLFGELSIRARRSSRLTHWDRPPGSGRRLSRPNPEIRPQRRRHLRRITRRPGSSGAQDSFFAASFFGWGSLKERGGRAWHSPVAGYGRVHLPHMRFTTKLKLGKRHRGAVRRFLFFVIHHKETGIGQELFSYFCVWREGDDSSNKFL